MLKFMRNTIILPLLFVAIDASGKFAVLNAPNSLDFQGNDPVRGEEVGNIVSAAVGGTVDDGSSSWSCLTVVEPFGLPSHAVVALIDGINMEMTPAKYEYPVEGNGALDSLNNMLDDMKANKVSTCHVDYSAKKGKSANKCFGISAVSDSNTLPKTSDLNANNEVDNKFLQAIADLNSAIDNYAKQQGSKGVEMKEIVVVRLSLAPLVSEYGVDAAQVTEATNLVKNALVKLQKVAGNALFIVVSGTEEEELTKSRSKREALAPSATNDYNLAKYYSSDYPVIFNIILWFMVVFGLSLLAISYAIGSMDPGRDSIIYRMTSTRMKKDN